MGVSFLPPKSWSMQFFSSGEECVMSHQSISADTVYINGIKVASKQIRQIWSCIRPDVQLPTNMRSHVCKPEPNFWSERTSALRTRNQCQYQDSQVYHCLLITSADALTFHHFPVHSQITTTRRGDYLNNQATGRFWGGSCGLVKCRRTEVGFFLPQQPVWQTAQSDGLEMIFFAKQWKRSPLSLRAAGGRDMPGPPFERTEGRMLPLTLTEKKQSAHFGFYTSSSVNHVGTDSHIQYFILWEREWERDPYVYISLRRKTKFLNWRKYSDFTP